MAGPPARVAEAEGIQPRLPADPRLVAERAGIVQQLVAREIGGRAQRRIGIEQGRRAHRKDLFAHQVRRLEIGEVAEPVADREVGLVAMQVDGLPLRADDEVDVRMARAEGGQPPHQPAGRERRQHGEGEPPRRGRIRAPARWRAPAGRSRRRRRADRPAPPPSASPRAPGAGTAPSPSRSSSPLICWLMAPAVTPSSAAAFTKLPWRAAASKARRAVKGGKRRMHRCLS